MKFTEFKKILRDTFPVFAGYTVLGIGFGILMRSAGFGFWLPIFMSLFIFAGSLQFAAIGLLTGGASVLTIILTTVAIQIRHLFYGISMIDKYKGAGLKKPYMIFALTDETYSLVCNSERNHNYYFAVSIVDQSYWVAGTVCGSFLGTNIPFDATGMDFALTALFITVFLEQWLTTKDHFPAIAGVAATAVCRLIFGAESFLIPSMVGITVILLLKMSRAEASNE